MSIKPTEFVLERLQEYDSDSVIAELRRVSLLESEGSFSKAKFLKHSRCHVGTVRRYLGSWKEALQKAGLSERYGYKGASSTKVREQRGKHVTKESVLQDIKRIALELGLSTLSREQFNSNAPYEANVVRKHFGTFSNALRAAGLNVGQHAHRYTEEECFENLLRVWTHYGRPPKYNEMSRQPSEVGGKAYVVRWETWSKALHAFVRNAERDSDPKNLDIELSSDKSLKDYENKEATSASDRREIRMGLRYAVLKRDAFKCRSCGRSPATTSGLELHVDHIKPFAKGGQTVMENLQTLCRDCNIGKSDTY